MFIALPEILKNLVNICSTTDFQDYVSLVSSKRTTLIYLKTKFFYDQVTIISI